MLHKVSSQIRESIVLPFCPAILGCQITAFNVAGLCENLAKDPHKVDVLFRPTWVKIPNRNSRVLRAGRGRPCCSRTAKEGDELATSHELPPTRLTI
jgi:hypothetical protein